MTPVFDDLPKPGKIRGTGQLVGTQHNPADFWHDWETGAQMARRTVYIRSDQQRKLRPLKRGSGIRLAEEPSLYLVNCGEPRYLEGGVTEWDEIYAEVPNGGREIVKHESFAMSYYIYLVNTSDGTLASVSEFPVTVPSELRLTYKAYVGSGAKTALKNDLKKLQRKFQLFNTGGFWFKVGEPKGTAPGLILAEDETLLPWKGNIYVKRSRWVENLNAARQIVTTLPA